MKRRRKTMTALYIRNRREAALVAAIARREYNRRTSIRDIMSNDRFLVNLADRLFGADPTKTRFIVQARDEIRAARAQRW
jgi:hypothetical protein